MTLSAPKQPQHPPPDYVVRTLKSPHYLFDFCSIAASSPCEALRSSQTIMTPLTFLSSGPPTPHRDSLRPSPRCSTFLTSSPLSAPPRFSEGVPRPTKRPQIQMKKGRFRQPMQPRRQDQQLSLPEDGTPVFAIFVRSPRAKLWYPLGAVQGDERSKGLVDALKGNFAKGMYENALDKGIAQTIYGKDGNRFMQSALRMYPQLKKSARELEFGYRVAAVGLDDQPTKVVSREMALPFFAWAKQQLDKAFKGLGQGK